MSTLAGSSQRQGSQRVYEQEVSLNRIFDELSEGFKRLDEMNDSKKQAELKRMTGLMQEAKSYVLVHLYTVLDVSCHLVFVDAIQIDPGFRARS